MRIWKFALAGSVLTAMVLVPFASDTEEIASPDRLAGRPPALENLAARPLATIAVAIPVRIPSNLPARSPITIAGSGPQRPLRGIRICVDPGHGGQTRMSSTHYTGGAVGVSTRQTESDVNLRVSLLLQQYLEAAGAEVVMTRVSDDRCTRNPDKQAELDFRTNLANARGCDLFLSVHHNDAGRSQSNYSAVFYPSNTVKSVSLAENIGQALHMNMGVMTIGAKSGKYRVLDHIQMPGVIVEASFMTNYEEDRRLSSLAYNKLEAKAIATGVLNYYRLTKGRDVDFNGIFAPIDTKAGYAKAVADASFVRREIVERKSLFGTSYEELTYDPQGRVTARREVGSGTNLVAKTANKALKGAVVVASTVKEGTRRTAVKASKALKAGPGAQPIVGAKKKIAAPKAVSKAKPMVSAAKRKRA